MEFLKYTCKEDLLKLPVEKESIFNAILLSGFIPTKKDESIYCRCFRFDWVDKDDFTPDFSAMNDITDEWVFVAYYIFINIKTGEIFYSSNFDLADDHEYRKDLNIAFLKQQAKMEIANIYAVATQLELEMYDVTAINIKDYRFEQSCWVDLLPKEIEFNLEGIDTDIGYFEGKHMHYLVKSRRRNLNYLK